MSFGVSVIIPTYNRADLILYAVESVKKQTYRPIECIVVDDGSTDNTKQVLDDFQKGIDEKFTFKYIVQSNSGAQVARNTGTAVATGEFIQYLDSDDLLYPDKISTQVEYFNLHPECDAVFGDWDNGSIEAKNFIKAYKSETLIPQMLTLERSLANFSILTRKSLIDKIGPWDVKLKRCQEIDYHLRGLLLGANYDYQPINTGLWRFHDGDRIRNQTDIYDFVFFYQKWENLLQEKKLFSNEIGIKISQWYMWILSQDTSTHDWDVSILREVIRLNPAISFFTTPKMKLLRGFLGKNYALKLWLARAKKQSAKSN